MSNGIYIVYICIVGCTLYFEGRLGQPSRFSQIGSHVSGFLYCKLGVAIYCTIRELQHIQFFKSVCNSQNTKCDHKVSFPKSGHIYTCVHTYHRSFLHSSYVCNWYTYTIVVCCNEFVCIHILYLIYCS